MTLYPRLSLPRYLSTICSVALIVVVCLSENISASPVSSFSLLTTNLFHKLKPDCGENCIKEPSKNIQSHFTSQGHQTSRSYGQKIRDSLKGKNSGMYKSFVFNDVFETTHNDALMGTPEGHEYVIQIFNKVENNLNLTKRENRVWNDISRKLLNAYDYEKAVIFYNFRIRGWQLCAQINIPFPTKDDKPVCFNVCVKLPITLNDVTIPEVVRNPVELQDFVTDEDIEQLRQINEEDTIYNDRVLVFNRQLEGSNYTNAIDVDLFSSSAFSENCVEVGMNSDSCHTLCCNTMYIDSEFCRGYPLTCATF